MTAPQPPGGDPRDDVHELTEVLAPGPVNALAGLLDLDTGGLPPGRLPPLWHCTHLLDRPVQAAIGPDGHPLHGGVVTPPGPGRRRMFAGGRVRTHTLLRTGEPATRRSRVLRTAEKDGRSGRLTFVTVEHTYLQNHEVALVEEADIVYRDGATGADGAAPPPPAPPPPAPPPPEAPAQPGTTQGPTLALEVDETLLFRFSALTYNAHRIHYDTGWAAHEGYPGLVVHGPLQVLLLGELLRRSGPGLVGHELDYRLRRPAVGTQRLVAEPGEDGLAHGAQVRDAAGRVTASGRIAPLATSPAPTTPAGSAG
ncbi:mesaconyl-C(4)-CoA hydratase [Janibacter alkaliphilus]|uniref:3-methylfumaryl-CoA hydratase n=1 Tax=Janibacter alkaliphilus TaxID=1069963 RepID=A0A852XCM3_9MICO|nr:MaoC family dehydratase N-terminal domain-containing protein [Janibacter alkaliphilus]NYG36215.1 3-methylfumaryl-CoA hydratase [Janibacter alkaliphilus]